MSLLTEFLAITHDWRSVFSQQRTFQRGVRQALGSLVCLGRRCLSRIIWTNGGQHRSWSAEYFLHPRCQWEPQQLLQPIWKRALVYCPQRLVGVALDDTRLRKTGRSIPLRQEPDQAGAQDKILVLAGERCASTKAAPGRRLRFSMGTSGARFAIKRSPRSTGSAALDSVG
jgi:hypothetical protein